MGTGGTGGEDVVLLTLRDGDRPGAPGHEGTDVAVGLGPGGGGRPLEEVADELAAVLDSPAGGGGDGDGRASCPGQDEDVPARRASRPPRWTCGGRRLSGADVLGLPPLVHGAVLVRRTAAGDAPQAVRPVPVAPLSLHVVAGPDAGVVVPLGPGTHEVGRSVAADLPVADPLVSRRHVRVRVERDGVGVSDLGSSNGTRLDGVVLPGEGGDVPLRPGARLRLGGTTAELRLGTTAAPPPGWDGRGGRRVAPAPPPPAAPGPRRLTRPAWPAPPEPPRTAWLPALLPLCLAVPMALLWSPWVLLMGLAAPLVAVAGTSVERRQGARRHAAASARAQRLRDAVDGDVHDAVRAESAARRRLLPGATDVLAALTGTGPGLWARPVGGGVLVSVGTGDAPSSTVVEEDDADGRTGTRRPLLPDVPLVVDLDAAGGLALVGPRPAVVRTATWVVLQVAALHRPDDVRVVVVTGDGPDDDVRTEPSSGAAARGPEGPETAGPPWSWARWLPAVGPDGVVVGTERARALAEELRPTLPPGTPVPTGTSRAGTVRTLLVLDDVDLLRTAPGLADLVREGPRCGVRTLVLAPRTTDVPAGCGATATLRPGAEHDLSLDPAGSGGPTDLRGAATGVSPALAARVARASAPLRLPAVEGPAAALPARVGLAALLGAPVPGPAHVLAAWRATGDRGGVGPVPVGVAQDGPRLLDLPTDGPHVLVAGTTGAGKSELLRTVVASLAWHHAPADLSFVLVDYKGGAAFSGVADLPHVLGLVTDLDHRLTARALRSLGAEVQRREALLRRVGAADLAGYRSARRPQDPPLGRLVLVVDEFRVLAEELPDFVDGLVRLAAVGRSLGLHLVLATQRPAGVVGPDMAANVNLRVALRVRDEHDSLDVVEARDAARLPASLPGRSLWRTGGGPLEEVQVASGSAPAPPGASVRVVGPAGGDGRPPRAGSTVGRERRGGDEPGPGTPSSAAGAPRGHADAADDATGDLGAVVGAVVAAARLVAAPVPPSPWPDPLPASVPLPASDPRAPRVLRWGRVDDPARQEQRPLEWDTTARGHLLVVGGPRSGRTGAARALVAAAAQAGLEHVVVHVVDTSGELADAAPLPGVASVVAGDDTEHAARVLGLLVEEVARRREGAREEVGGPQAAGAATTPRPTLLLVVDGYDGVVGAWDEEDGGACAALLERLLRDGPGADVLVVLTAGPRVLGGRVGAAVGERVVLALADPVDAVLAGLPARAAVVGGPPGRGTHVPARGARAREGGPTDATPEPLEVQVADVRRLQAAPSPTPDHGLLPRPRAGAGRPTPAQRDVGVPRVPALPRRVDEGDLREEGAPSHGALLLGAGGPRVEALHVDLAHDGPLLPVLGTAGSGRTTALVVLGRSALALGATTVVLGRPLPGLGGPASSPGGTADGTSGPLHVPLGDGTALRDVVAGRRPDRPLVLLVDDADLLVGSRESDLLAGWASGLLGVGAAGTGSPVPGDLVVVAGTTATASGRGGLLAVGRRTRTGVLLGPSGPLDGELLGLPPGPRRAPGPPGRGLLVRRGVAVTLQVAVPRSPGTPSWRAP